MSLFGVVCKKSRFSILTIKNVSLTLPHFASKANQNSESGSKGTTGLILMPQI